MEPDRFRIKIWLFSFNVNFLKALPISGKASHREPVRKEV